MRRGEPGAVLSAGPPGGRRRVVGWLVASVLVAACTAGFAALDLPSPLLFGAVVGSMAYAVFGTGRRIGALGTLPTLTLPRRAPIVGQAVIGVSIGALIDPTTLRELAGSTGAAIAVAGLATLAVSIVSGWVFARVGGLSAATGVFSMIAGGASGITAIARELGADDRVVSVIQYVRVLLILVGMPVVAALVFRPEHTGAVLVTGGSASWVVSLAYVVGCGVVGTYVGTALRLPAGALLGPLAVAIGVGLLVASRTSIALGVPDLVLSFGYVLIGAYVGLRFTPTTLRSIARLLPAAIGLIVAVIVVSAGLGVLLARVTGQSALDGYLATTPGGLYAVLATAVDAGADVTFVLAVQVIRLVIMLAAAPLLSRVLRPGPGRR